MNDWTPRKLLLASMGVAILSSAAMCGLVIWVMSGRKTAEAPVFSPNAPPETALEAAAPPGDPVQVGNWFYDRQRWAEAISAYEKALASGLDNPNVRTDLGNCYRFSHRPEAALEQYQIAQKQDPAHEHSLFNQASLYAEGLKNPAKADELARLFLANFPASENAAAVKKYLLAPAAGAK